MQENVMYNAITLHSGSFSELKNIIEVFIV